MTDDNAMLLDISNHFSHKMRRQIIDIASTCKLVELDEREVIMMIMACLAYEMVRASACMGLDEKQFLTLCKTAYREMIVMARSESGQQ